MTDDPMTKDRFHALLDRVESIELDTLVNVASDLATALRAATSYPAIGALVRACEDDPSLTVYAYARLEDLCHRSIDSHYVSPYDSAILAVLFMLNQCEPFAVAAAAAAALQAPNTYWAARFAGRLLDGLRPATLTENTLRLTHREVPVAISRSRSTLTRPIQEVAFDE
jgi:hypothetical protein